MGKVRLDDNNISNIYLSPVIAVLQLFRGYHAGLGGQVKYHEIQIHLAITVTLVILRFYLKGDHVQTDNKFFDDLAKLGQSAVGTLHGVKGEVEAMIRARLEHIFRDMDLVSREEFDVVSDMAKAARAENAALKKKIMSLEKALKPKKTKSTKK